MKQSKLNSQKIYSQALIDAFLQLNPRSAIQKPTFLIVWLGTIITFLITIFPNLFGELNNSNSHTFNGLVTLLLLLNLYGGNLGKALAQAKLKVKAKRLQLLQSGTISKKLSADGVITEVPSASLRRGDTIYVVAGDIIPADGEVVLGVGSVDESFITGESTLVIKELGSEVASSVTEGTRIISDELIIRVTANPGQGLVGRMINVMIGKREYKNSNEIALQILLSILTIIFLCVVITLSSFATYLGMPISVTFLVALLVSLIPVNVVTSLSTMSIATIDNITNANVIASSDNLEQCIGVNTLVVDKTGTITLGNRLAEDFIPICNHLGSEVAVMAMAASIFDDTLEGKSIFRLAEQWGAKIDFEPQQCGAVYFSTTTRISGTNLPNNSKVRKGSLSAIREFVGAQYHKFSSELNTACERIALQGGTPLVVCRDNEIYGVIYLKDVVKPGIRDRFYKLKKLGIYTIMVTGDNQITAGVISREAGIDDFIAEATPNDKIAVIRQQQSQGKLVAMIGEGNNDVPALSQADISLAMNAGTQAARLTARIVDLDSDPTKLIEIVAIGKQLLMTRGALTLFSLTNNIGKYLAVLPMLFTPLNLGKLNFIQLSNTNSAVLSLLIYNVIAVFAFIPLVLRGIKFRSIATNEIFQINILIYGLGGLFIPLVIIKLLDISIKNIGFI